MLETCEYGSLEDNTKVTMYKLDNGRMKAALIDYGASLVSMETPDGSGKMEDVTLAWSSLEGWVTNECYFGATVGRYANRIAGGKFTLDETDYRLAVNNGPNHLHGGIVGFNRRMWTASSVESRTGNGVKFEYSSPDGEEGYPGRLDVSVTYTLTSGGELKIEYEGITDKPTIVNLTHHSYWNLAGHHSGSILDHRLQLNASSYLPVDENSIPTGQPASVENTPMDFRKPRRIGEGIDSVEGGYDHNWCLDADSGLSQAAVLSHPGTGRVMEMETTEPGVQFYTANFLSGEKGKDEATYPRRSGLCLEAQKWPDSPNRPGFPSAVLRPGETYRQTCIYRFYTG